MVPDGNIGEIMTEADTDDEADQNDPGPQSAARDALPRAFGVLLRRRRAALGLSQSELALASGVGRRFVIELEAGKPSCQLGKALVVAEALGLRVVDLIAAIADPHVAEDLDSGGRPVRGKANAEGVRPGTSSAEEYDLPDDIEEPSP
jgi:HTH-type transcriptional regulator / antitoxin HipB